MLNVGVLISGRGSNLQALIDAAKTPGYPAQIVCVISDDPSAAGLEKARDAGIAAHVINHREFPSREAFERVLDATLNDHAVQLTCLAGFMRLLTPWFVTRWRDRFINIHPSLLPAFPGLDTHNKALNYGVKFTGCTVHFVRAEMDHGPIIIQAAVPILPKDNEETLAARVLVAEHRIYPQAVHMIAEGHVNIFEEKVFIAGAQSPVDSIFNPLDHTALALSKPFSS